MKTRGLTSLAMASHAGYAWPNLTRMGIFHPTMKTSISNAWAIVTNRWLCARGLLPLCLVWVVMIPVAASAAERPSSRQPVMPNAAIDQLLQAYQGDVPGASLLVLKDDVPLVARGMGRSDLEAALSFFGVVERR